MTFKRITYWLVVFLFLPTLTVLVVSASSPQPHLATITTTRDAHGRIAINEVMFQPIGSAPEWVELLNMSDEAVNIDAFRISDEDGNFYEIPSALPPMPPGAFVVVIFDGVGGAGNDLNFSDGVATLHTSAGLTDIFEDAADQVALYDYRASLDHFITLPLVQSNYAPFNPTVPSPPSEFTPPSLISFVAWGEPAGQDAAIAEAAGLWSESWYVTLYHGLGEETGEALAAPGESIGVLQGGSAEILHDWTLYSSSETTRGARNRTPTVNWSYPANGATLAASTFIISWNDVANATGYHFQLATDASFTSIVVDEVLGEPTYRAAGAVADGTYFWRTRVQASTGNSGWSTAQMVNVITLPQPPRTEINGTRAGYNVLGLTWQQQKKDTKMLCLDGDNEAGTHPWNAPHADRGTHGRNYCVRASVAMIADYYGGNLSQDRITYETFKGGSPTGDLGHDVPFTGTQARASLSWALGVNSPAHFGKPSFSQIQNWIDDGRALRVVIPGHSRVIDGYFEFDLLFTQYQMLHVLDPWDGAKWVDYASDNIVYVQPGPDAATGAPNVKSDEDVDNDGIADTIDDSDNDGIVDFDERNRLATIYNDKDSDNDDVLDGADVRGYVFANNGTYALRSADIDNDGKRKEVDSDNDHAANDGTLDGCEDRDHDGKYEAAQGETNNFSPVDDKLLHIRLTWPQVGSDVDIHLLRPGGTFGSYDDVYYANRSPDWGPAGRCGNPTLDVDCITSCTVENIRLDTLEPGTYTVIVHYYYDHEQGPTPATVTIKLGDRLFQHTKTVADGERWTATTITWPLSSSAEE